MSIFRTIALFVYLFGYMIVHYSVLCKAERALAAGDTETVRQLVKKHIPHWSKGILNVTGVRLSVEGLEYHDYQLHHVERTRWCGYRQRDERRSEESNHQQLYL